MNGSEVLNERSSAQKQISWQQRWPTHLLSLAMASLMGRLAGVGEDAASLRSSAGETLVGFVVANSRTNWSMSARGYFIGPEPKFL